MRGVDARGKGCGVDAVARYRVPDPLPALVPAEHLDRDGVVLAWTFGVMSRVGITFNQPFVIVVLLITLSIDYAIHVVMRYREERSGEDGESGGSSPRPAMRTALSSVGVTLALVGAGNIWLPVI